MSERHDQVAPEGDDGAGQEDPARLLGDEGLLAEELGDVVVGLEDARPSASLDPSFDVRDHAAHERCAKQDGQDLQGLNSLRS